MPSKLWRATKTLPSISSKPPGNIEEIPALEWDHALRIFTQTMVLSEVGIFHQMTVKCRYC